MMRVQNNKKGVKGNHFLFSCEGVFVCVSEQYWNEYSICSAL